MKISFLVTYYNQKQYVSDSLKSILNLNLSYEYEVLIGNDGSTDGTLQEIECWAGEFGSKLKVFTFSREDGVSDSIIRVSNARKRLLSEATGDYVCFLDGDDYYCDTDFVDEAVEIMENSDIAIVMNDYKSVFDDHTDVHKLSDAAGRIDTAFYLLNMYTPAGACVFRNAESELLENALTFDDNDIVIFFLNYGEIWYSGRCVYSYRQVSGSSWNSKNRIQQACANVLGADVGAYLNPENAGLIYYRYAMDILFLYAYRNELNKYVKRDERDHSIKMSLLLNGVSHAALDFEKASREEKKAFEGVVEAIREVFPKKYTEIVEQRPLDKKTNDNEAIENALTGIASYIDNVNRFVLNVKESFEKEMSFVSNGVIDNRLKLKTILKEKVNVVFIAHRPEVWNSERTFYEALKADDCFNVNILAVWVKKDYAKNDENYVDEGAEWFCREYGAIDAYNPESGEWFDLQKLRPDYVFYQQPYNAILCNQYKSENVSKYAKICYIPYGMQIAGGEILSSVTPRDFMNSTSFYFAGEKDNAEDINKCLRLHGNFFTNVVTTGTPRMDLISDCEKNDRGEKYRVLWLPRWCVGEGNCCFFDYKDLFLDYCEKNSDFELILRQHPQASRELVKTGLMSQDEQNAYNDRIENLKNAELDLERDYLKSFADSDCLVADMTSLMGEYFLTGKPIVYCYKCDCFTRFGDKLAQGFYYARNWNELVSILSMLKSGEDPLKEDRLKIRDELLGKFIGENIGERIKEFIKNDALK